MRSLVEFSAADLSEKEEGYGQGFYVMMLLQWDIKLDDEMDGQG